MAATNPVYKFLAGLTPDGVKAMLDALKANPATAKDAAEVEAFMNAERENIAKVKRQSEAELAKIAQEQFLSEVKDMFANVKLDGFRVSFDVKSVTVKPDGTIDNLNAVITSASLNAVQEAITASVVKALAGRKPRKDVKLAITSEGVSIVDVVKLSVPKSGKSGKSDNSEGAGKSRGGKAILLNGKLYETGSDACKALGIEPGKASAWKVLLAKANGEKLKAAGAVFSGSRTGVEDDIVRNVNAGNITVQDDLEETPEAPASAPEAPASAPEAPEAPEAPASAPEAPEAPEAASGKPRTRKPRK